MISEENMNVNLEKNDENQENFEKKKKIVLISLSAAVILITLIAGLFFVKKSKESSHENNDNDIEKVVNNNDNVNDNDNNNEKPNSEEVIVNEDDYFFNRKSGQVTTNILLFLVVGILFFFWENDKLPEEERGERADLCERLGEFSEDFLCSRNAYCGKENIKKAKDVGFGLFEKSNWFGFATLGALIVTTFLVEFVLNLLIGSISHFLSKDKSKRYLHTLRMSLRKRIQYFLSFSVVKTFLVVVGYLLCGIIVAMVARTARKYHPCCCRAGTGEIITGHGANYCFGFCEVSIGMQKGSDNQEEMRQVKFIPLDNMLQNQQDIPPSSMIIQKSGGCAFFCSFF